MQNIVGVPILGALAVVRRISVIYTYSKSAGSGQRLLYRLGSGLGLVLVLVLRFCAYSYGGIYNRNTAGAELQQQRPNSLLWEFPF